MSGSGTGAPPQIAERTDDRSAAAHRGERAIARNIAGTPNRNVTRYRSISSSVPSGSKADTRIAVPPLQNVGSTVWLSAATWNIGALTSVTSVLVTSTSTRRLTVFQVTLAWVSMTPLGRPVVPEVYMTMQVSPGSTGRSSGSGSAVDSAAS